MNVFLFFYLFILFILLTPGTIISLKSSISSPWIITAIHGFLFSAIAITTYSFVNELYQSLTVTENLYLNTGYTYSSSNGAKKFNTLSNIKPSKIADTANNGPKIKCGSHKFCASADPINQKVYCYGDKNGCKWNGNDCNTDGDCKKYNGGSLKYTDYDIDSKSICSRYPRNSWPGEICQLSGIPVSDEDRTFENRCIHNFRYNKDGPENVTCPADKPTCTGFINGRAWGTCK
jgi:hypothetical protein